MGSRAIVVVCRDADVARERFCVDDGETGAIYTRTGRPFLDGAPDTEAALSRVRGAVESAGLWDGLGTGWLVLDCELLPWSAKAIGLNRRQYASVGSAARAGLSATVAALQGRRGPWARRHHVAGSPVPSDRARGAPPRRLSTLRLARRSGIRSAPGAISRPRRRDGCFIDRDHTWHLERCDRLVAADPDWFRSTGRRGVDVTDADDQVAGAAWWEELTASGGEGMVVKPMTSIPRSDISICVYPDSEKVSVHPLGKILPFAAEVDYWHGEA